MPTPEILHQKQSEITEKIKQVAQEHNEYRVIDGIINPKKYLNAKHRILWLLKEPVGSSSWSFIEEFNQKTDWLKKVSLANITLRRVIYTSYAILRDSQWSDIPYADEEKAFECLQEIAYVNIKKSPGDSVSEVDVIQHHYNRNKELLKEQIHLCNADVIIFGNTLPFYDKELFEGLLQAKEQRTDWGNVFYDTGKKLYIWTWHPAVRGAGFNDAEYVMDIANIVKQWSK